MNAGMSSRGLGTSSSLADCVPRTRDRDRQNPEKAPKILGLFHFKYIHNMTFFVYILQSLKDHSFYIGYTSNLDNRVQEHNEGFTRYTSKKRPWELVYFETFDSKAEAIKREKFLKKQKNREFYERLINKPK